MDRSFLAGRGLIEGSTVLAKDKIALDAAMADATQNKVKEFPWTNGGAGANVAKALAYFGIRCALYGKVGLDFGGKIIEHFRQIGVTPFLSPGKDCTGTVNCYITPEKRTMETYPGVCTEFSKQDISEEPFKDVKLVNLDGYLKYGEGILETAISYAEKQGAKISLSLASTDVVKLPGFKECASKAHFVFGNVKEMEALTGIADPEKAVEKFASFQTVVITEREKGCWVKNMGESSAVHYQAKKVLQVVDPTGAGDFFQAGFLFGALRGETAGECVRMGNEAASTVIQHEGTDLPDHVQESLKHRTLKV